MAVFDPLERERLPKTCADINKLVEAQVFPNSSVALTRKYMVLKVAVAER